MKIGIIGSGEVAQAIAPKMLELGNEVMISARDTGMGKKREWGNLPSVMDWVVEREEEGLKGLGGTFREAAEFGELIFNCTSGAHSLEALQSAGAENLNGKILIDLANPLSFSDTGEVTLTICNTTSLGEALQAAFPDVKIVKTLNHVTSELMTNPGLLSVDTQLYIAGNDADAKAWVADTVLKKWFGWKNVLDLGGMESARGLEMYLILWLSLWKTVKTPIFNFKLVSTADGSKHKAKKKASIKKQKPGRKIKGKRR